MPCVLAMNLPPSSTKVNSSTAGVETDVALLLDRPYAPTNTPPIGIPINGRPEERDELCVTRGPLRGSTKVTPSITKSCSSLSVAALKSGNSTSKVWKCANSSFNLVSNVRCWANAKSILFSITRPLRKNYHTDFLEAALISSGVTASGAGVVGNLFGSSFGAIVQLRKINIASSQISHFDQP